MNRRMDIRYNDPFKSGAFYAGDGPKGPLALPGISGQNTRPQDADGALHLASIRARKARKRVAKTIHFVNASERSHRSCTSRELNSRSEIADQESAFTFGQDERLKRH